LPRSAIHRAVPSRASTTATDASSCRSRCRRPTRTSYSSGGSRTRVFAAFATRPRPLLPLQAAASAGLAAVSATAVDRLQGYPELPAVAARRQRRASGPLLRHLRPASDAPFRSQLPMVLAQRTGGAATTTSAVRRNLGRTAYGRAGVNASTHLAEIDGRPVAGAVFLHWNRILVYEFSPPEPRCSGASG
jgi:hypothetical protein